MKSRGDQMNIRNSVQRPGSVSPAFRSFWGPPGFGSAQGASTQYGWELFYPNMVTGMNPSGYPGQAVNQGVNPGLNPVQYQDPGALWKQIGGLDGVITQLQKMQKIYKLTQSFSPIMKLFTSSVGGAPLVRGKQHVKKKRAGG
jgi:hypothetical protein